MIWPFPIIRNYRADEVLTELFLRFSRTDFDIVENGTYELHLRGPMGELKFWNTNRWYAWASQGSFQPAGKPGAFSSWNNLMPSRWAVRQMRLAVEKIQMRRLQAVYDLR